MGLYRFTQLYLKAGFRLFYRKVHTHNLQRVPLTGPVLLVPNHPNGFMDPLLIGSYLPRPTCFLARGDVFNIPLLAPVFRSFNMIPVYRTSEGKENIGKNFESFDASFEALTKGACLMIFGEGLCENNWQLRPMKKGAARIAQRAWNSGTEAEKLVVIPVGITYSNYTGAGKSVLISYGEPLKKKHFGESLHDGSFTMQLNQAISKQLHELAFFDDEMHRNKVLHEAFEKRWIYAEKKRLPLLAHLKDQAAATSSRRSSSRIGTTLVTWPHYFACRMLTKKLTAQTVFYDSVLFLVFWLLMPLYLGSCVWLMLSLR